MNADLVPAVAAATGGTALLGGIWTHEQRRDRRMRDGRSRIGVRFPVGLEPERALAALDSLSGLPHTSELVMEVSAREGAVRHAIWIPAAIRSSAQSALRGVIPNLRTDEEAPPPEHSTLALRLVAPSFGSLSTEHPVEVSRALLTGLVGLRESEALTLRWALRPGPAQRRREPARPDTRERDADRAWRRKTAGSGFAVEGLVLITAASLGRARELSTHVATVMRGRRGPSPGIRVIAAPAGGSLWPRCRRRSGWLASAELLGLLGWPLGPEAVPGVEVGAARTLLVPRHVPREGRPLLIGQDTHGERPVALSDEAARHHTVLAGTSGSGKSTLVAGSVLSEVKRGHAGMAVDPKADLIRTILEHGRPEDAERIVVLDPGDTSRPVPGIDVLRGGDLDARADVLTRTLKSMFPDWGIRSEIWGRLGIRTLSEVPGATLLDLGRLFADESYRRMAVGRLRDDYLVSSWQSYEALSPAARADVVQAPMARVMALLSRPRVRAVLAHPQPKLDVARVFAERKFLLVSLAPGVLGEAAPLIASAVMFAAWSAIEARAAIPPERRHLISLFVDELATLTSGLPMNLELVAERARGLGASLTVALQTLSRIPEPTRSALLGNAATFVTWRAPAEEAAAVARQLPGLTPDDVMALGRYEVAARVGTGAGASVAVVTGHTEPLSPPLGHAESIRDHSARVYGGAVPTEPALGDHATSDTLPEDGPTGRVRREA